MALGNLGHSERMRIELDDTSNMLAKLTESLNTDCVKGHHKDDGNEVFEQDPLRSIVRRRSRVLSSNTMNRLGIVSSLSTSEPGMYVYNIKVSTEGHHRWSLFMSDYDNM